MNSKKIEQVAQQMNELGQAREPFFFAIDFEGERPVVFPLSNLEKEGIHLDFSKSSNSKEPIQLQVHPMNWNSYEEIFSEIKKNILYGNSYLCNLTAPTPIETNLTLQELYEHAVSKYKILFKNQWLCFSPETFVELKEGKIYSYPMKGTIDASVPNARQTLLDNKKELAEHYTIVDLIRNDLNRVAENVQVQDFRFITEINTAKGKLLQASSKIMGDLSNDWEDKVGSILCTLLPAGSISGAPKKKTVEIILEHEKYARGYYTGVAGVYDGKELNSCVLIRFIEKTENGFVYKSGGGITKYSDAESEYQELIQKIYVPTT